MSRQMRRLCRLAADELVNAVKAKALEAATPEVLAESAGIMLLSWAQAQDSGVIAEDYDRFEDWLADYATVCAQDVVDLLRGDPTTGDQVGALSTAELDAVEQALVDHVVGQAGAIEPIIADELRRQGRDALAAWVAGQ